MKLVISTVLVTACFSIALIVQPTVTATNAASTAASALQLLQQSLTVLSPSIKTNDVTLTGSVHYIAGSTDENGIVTVKAISNGASFMELDLPSVVQREFRNLTVDPPVGVWSLGDAASHQIPLHNLYNEPSWFFPAAALNRAIVSPTSVATVVGSSEVANTNAQQISVLQQYPQAAFQPPIASHLSEIDFFLDPITSLPVAIAFDTHPDDDASLDIPVRVEFSDYTSVSGTQIPFHIQRFINNRLALDLQFNSAVINSGLSPTSIAIQ
jgi:hypothetical protein